MKKVFQLLKSANKSQVALAKHCGVSKGAVTNWKRGGNVAPTHARAIVRFFDGMVTLEDIYPEQRRRKAS